jgi:hypothetical protein
MSRLFGASNLAGARLLLCGYEKIVIPGGLCKQQKAVMKMA